MNIIWFWPGLLPAGSCGATIETKDGKVLVYRVIGSGRSEEVPEFGNVYNLEA